MKKGWEKRFDEMWFDSESTIMNWSGLIKGDESIFDQIFGSYRSAKEIELSLKRELATFVKDFIKRESK